MKNKRKFKDKRFKGDLFKNLIILSLDKKSKNRRRNKSKIIFNYFKFRIEYFWRRKDK